MASRKMIIDTSEKYKTLSPKEKSFVDGVIQGIILCKSKVPSSRKNLPSTAAPRKPT